MTELEQAYNDLLTNMYLEAKGDYKKYMFACHGHNENFTIDGFYENYYKILDMFAKGEIKNLIITMPPQHGKTFACTDNLAAYIRGLRPNSRIAVMSYSDKIAKKFKKAITRNEKSVEFSEIFPDVDLTGGEDSANFSDYPNTNGGFLTCVGRGGALTSMGLDLGILDDLYKNNIEANSTVIREGVIETLVQVVMTRLHNNSQLLATFTRWHHDDAIGYIEEKFNVVEPKTFKDITDTVKNDRNTWIKINLEAIKESEPTEIDPREIGEALAPNLHNKEKLELFRSADPEIFNAMFQGNPISLSELMYPNIQTYENYNTNGFVKCVVDPAGLGTNYFSAIAYIVDYHRFVAYVVDIYHNQSDNEEAFINFVVKNQVREIEIEVDGVGAIQQKLFKGRLNVKFSPFNQPKNLSKEDRLRAWGNTVARKVMFPFNWQQLWPLPSKIIRNFSRVMKKNNKDHYDIPDCLTMIIQRNKILQNPLLTRSDRDDKNK